MLCCVLLTDVISIFPELNDYFDLTFQNLSPELREEIRTSAVLVNATPVGMDGGKGSGRCLIPDASFLRPDLFVYDIIYHPKETPLLALAASAGCRTSNGESMLLMQGAAAFRIWTGRDMPVDLIREKVF